MAARRRISRDSKKDISKPSPLHGHYLMRCGVRRHAFSHTRSFGPLFVCPVEAANPTCPCPRVFEFARPVMRRRRFGNLRSAAVFDTVMAEDPSEDRAEEAAHEKIFRRDHAVRRRLVWD